MEFVHFAITRKSVEINGNCQSLQRYQSNKKRKEGKKACKKEFIMHQWLDIIQWEYLLLWKLMLKTRVRTGPTKARSTDNSKKKRNCNYYCNLNWCDKPRVLLIILYTYPYKSKNIFQLFYSFESNAFFQSLVSRQPEQLERRLNRERFAVLRASFCFLRKIQFCGATTFQ